MYHCQGASKESEFPKNYLRTIERLMFPLSNFKWPKQEDIKTYILSTRRETLGNVGLKATLELQIKIEPDFPFSKRPNIKREINTLRYARPDSFKEKNLSIHFSNCL